MNEKTLKFAKDIHKSKQPVDLASVNVDQIVISGKFKHSDKSFNYFIGYKKVKLLNRYVLFHRK